MIRASSLKEQGIAKRCGLGSRRHIRNPLDFIPFAAAIRKLGIY
jgi:hypothetical protein